MLAFGTYRAEWSGNVRGDLLSGPVVALALIPKAIAFSTIAGVDPKMGFYASFSIAVLIAPAGGRSGMISAAIAATAVLMVTLVRDHGLQCLLVATVLARLLQIGAGLLRLGLVMRYVSKSVITWLAYAIVAAGLAIIYLFSLSFRAVPLRLVTIVVLTVLSIAFGWGVRTMGDMGALPDTLPVFMVPQILLTLQMLLIIPPYSAAIAVVGCRKA